VISLPGDVIFSKKRFSDGTSSNRGKINVLTSSVHLSINKVPFFKGRYSVSKFVSKSDF
jgi:hypothetical protein